MRFYQLYQVTRNTSYYLGIWCPVIHAVWIKNKLPHSNFNFKSTPFTEFTRRRPNLSKIKVSGCPVTVEKITTRRTKLSDNTNQGIFLEFANTFENCVYIDTTTNKVKVGRIKKFDEAHYTSALPPPGGKALLKAGMRKDSTLIPTTLDVHMISEKPQQKPNKKFLV